MGRFSGFICITIEAMACRICKNSVCTCEDEDIDIFDDRPEIIKVQNTPGPKGDKGDAGDVYVVELTDNFFDI